LFNESRTSEVHRKPETPRVISKEDFAKGRSLSQWAGEGSSTSVAACQPFFSGEKELPGRTGAGDLPDIYSITQFVSLWGQFHITGKIIRSIKKSLAISPEVPGGYRSEDRGNSAKGRSLLPSRETREREEKLSPRIYIYESSVPTFCVVNVIKYLHNKVCFVSRL
jgi:hypothetical protein